GGGGTGGTGGAAVGGTGGAGGGGGAPAGDTSHCKDGRQFDTAVDWYAPPCVPKFSGDNGGATYQGVSGDTITILQYRGKPNAQRTPNIGGWSFRDEFSNARAPYHWDVQMSYTRMHKHFAEYWCKQLQSTKTSFAGTNAVGQTQNGKPRVLGVIGTADPEN